MRTPDRAGYAPTAVALFAQDVDEGPLLEGAGPIRGGDREQVASGGVGEITGAANLIDSRRECGQPWHGARPQQNRVAPSQLAIYRHDDGVGCERVSPGVPVAGHRVPGVRHLQGPDGVRVVLAELAGIALAGDQAAEQETHR